MLELICSFSRIGGGFNDKWLIYWQQNEGLGGWVGGGWSFWPILEMTSSTYRDGGASSLRSGVLIVGDLYFQYKASPGIMTSFNTTEDSLPWRSPHSLANSRIEDDSFVSPKMNSHLLDSCM